MHQSRSRLEPVLASPSLSQAGSDAHRPGPERVRCPVLPTLSRTCQSPAATVRAPFAGGPGERASLEMVLPARVTYVNTSYGEKPGIIRSQQ